VDLCNYSKITKGSFPRAQFGVRCPIRVERNLGENTDVSVFSSAMQWRGFAVGAISDGTTNAKSTRGNDPLIVMSGSLYIKLANLIPVACF
jgi:hypothetical protein